MSKKIGILGGSFNPPHLGHLSVANQVMQILKLDEIWLMPCFTHAFNKILLKPQVRLAMTSLLVENRIICSDFEIQKATTSYTIETLNELKQQFLDCEFFWIMGSDQIVDFSKYKDWEEILSRHRLVIFPRENSKEKIKNDLCAAWHKTKVPETVTILEPHDVTMINISSSQIREKIKRGEDISQLVSLKVKHFLIANKLYR